METERCPKVLNVCHVMCPIALCRCRRTRSVDAHLTPARHAFPCVADRAAFAAPVRTDAALSAAARWLATGNAMTRCANHSQLPFWQSEAMVAQYDSTDGLVPGLRHIESSLGTHWEGVRLELYKTRVYAMQRG